MKDVLKEKTACFGQPVRIWKISKIVLLILILVTTSTFLIFWWLFSEWHLSAWTVEGFVMIVNCSVWSILSITSIIVMDRIGRRMSK